MAKYKVGDKVRIKYFTKSTYPLSWNKQGKMDHWCGQIMTIKSIGNLGHYLMEEDLYENDRGGWFWNEEWLEPITYFTKNDLRTGMTVKICDGDFYLVYGERLLGNRGYMEFDRYFKDLTCKHSGDDYDIVEVYDISKTATTLKNILDHPGTLIWSREPKEREISSEEAFKILKEHYGCDVKIKEWV